MLDSVHLNVGHHSHSDTNSQQIGGSKIAITGGETGFGGDCCSADSSRSNGVNVSGSSNCRRRWKRCRSEDSSSFDSKTRSGYQYTSSSPSRWRRSPRYSNSKSRSPRSSHSISRSCRYTEQSKTHHMSRRRLHQHPLRRCWSTCDNQHSNSRHHESTQSDKGTAGGGSDNESRGHHDGLTTSGSDSSWCVSKVLDAHSCFRRQDFKLEYSWGTDSAAKGQLHMDAWTCATGVQGRLWAESGFASDSSQLLPSALTMSECVDVGSLSSAAWQDNLRTSWNGELLIFALPQQEAGSGDSNTSHAELELVRLAGLMRASRQALVAPIASYGDGSDEGLCEARLWLTAGTEIVEALVLALPQEIKVRLATALVSRLHPEQQVKPICLFGVICVEQIAEADNPHASAEGRHRQQSH